jgi:hypothetical protein
MYIKFVRIALALCVGEANGVGPRELAGKLTLVIEFQFQDRATDPQ